MTKKVLGENHCSMLVQFTQGLDIDQLMCKEEIFVQKVWTKNLGINHYLSAQEVKAIIDCLTLIEKEMLSGQFNWKIVDEDIHMNIEHALTDRLGELGKKIHMGRSRNDLVATTQRLFVHNKIQEVLNLIPKLTNVICKIASDNLDVIIPGMTHQQSGQPVRFSHTFLAHGHALNRDKDNLTSAMKQALLYLPLGAAAFSGTHLNLDLYSLAKDLGFKAPVQNSYDAVGDRDFILSALNAYSILAVHINRLCQEIIYNSSTAVGLLILPKDWTTGSSIMPNKRNPDTIEITRAKMTRVISASQEALNIVSTVVPSYGSDLHELKRTFMNAHIELVSSLMIMIPFIDELQINQETAKFQCQKGHILATDFANRATDENNGNFRESYLLTKKMVEMAQKNNCQIHELENWPSEITFEFSVELRSLIGGTSKLSCLNQIKTLKLGKSLY